MNKCLYCEKPVKNKYCNVSCQNIHQWTGKKRPEKYIQEQKERIKNNWKTFSVVCYKCGKKIDVKEYKVEVPKKEKYYCSRSCANSRMWSEDDKKKKSNSATVSDKVKKSNENNKIRVYNSWSKNKKIERIVSKCMHCGENIEHKINKERKYHQECWLKCSGGVKKGSSRGKHGWYKGYWCDSSYELAWVIYNLEKGIKFKRNIEGFDYIYKGETHKYYPDFIKEDLYVEIKNYKSELTDAKLKFFPNKIEVLYKEEMKEEILPYVIKKYGKDFIKLYENKKSVAIERDTSVNNCL